MNPYDLIDASRELLKSGRGRPRQVNLRRSISTAYYALFHCLAGSCANAIVGGRPGDLRSRTAWQQAYRALDHGRAWTQCDKKDMIRGFPQGIRDFADMFTDAQDERHVADYDPFWRQFKANVLLDIDSVEDAIRVFMAVPLKDRRAFAVYVLLGVNRRRRKKRRK